MALLKEGDIITLKDGHEVYAKVPLHFVSASDKGCFDMVKRDITIGGQLSYFAGKYVVVKTTFDGGGSTYDGGYPNGHHVFCRKIDNDKIEVNFYQSGCFTAMITDIEPEGRATMQWVIDDKN